MGTTDTADDEEGTVHFQGFNVGELIHEGRTADVFRAIRTHDETRVILKVFKPAYPSLERIARVQREFEIGKSFDTRAVAKVWALEIDQHRHALVLEDFGAKSLATILKNRPLTLRKRIMLAISISEALSEVHRAGVVHKDLNPSNILWNEEQNRVALVDFGTATRSFAKTTHVLREDLPEGSIAYISPEQTGRTNRGIDYRTDLYSLGVTLYELFTDVLPFSTTDPAELMHAHLAIQPAAPRERRVDLPVGLSDLILKLMAKSAEDRYQGTLGVLADLRSLLARFEAGAHNTPFSVGLHDTPERLELPRKLYGREQDKQVVLATLDRLGSKDVADGVQVVLVSGSSGIGKSALVQQLRQPIAQRGGFFVSGKFDQLQRTGPFAAPIAALRGLARQLLSEPAPRLAAFRERLVAALGPNGQVLIDVIPEIEHIIGSQPPVAELGPIETQNRFYLVFRSFVRVVAVRSAPLCIFLDDLQWADSASLKWLDLLLEDDELDRLLLLGAYRDHEVGAGHPFTLTRNALRERATLIDELHLEPLGIKEISAMVADFVGSDTTHVRSLADLVMRKTAGNPLFAGELLKTIYEDGLIWLDREQGRWAWDIEAIERRGITENIIDIVIGKMRRLPEKTQQILRIAACVGNSFERETLAIIGETTPTNVLAHLEPAVTEGFLIPLTTSGERIAAQIEASSPIHYKFMHDRIQQAAYALIDEDQCKAVHLRIGRLLLAGTPEGGRAERIFDLADQMNRGLDLISDEAERIALVQLNLEAGKRAMAAAAHGAARDYLAIAAEILESEPFERQYDLAMAVHRSLAIAESLTGQGVEAEKRMGLVLEKAKTVVEQAEACNMLISQLTLVARYREAIDVARDGLARVGIDLPRENIYAAFEAELAASQATLGSRPIASLFDNPPIPDPQMGVAVQIFENIMSAALYTDPVLWWLCVVKGTHLCFRFGAPPESAALYAYYGHVLHMTSAQTALAYEFGELSLRLAERFNSAYARCLCGFVVANFILPWVRPLRHALPINRAAYQAGVDGGELRWSGYTLIYRLMNQFMEGKPIADIIADLPGFLAINQRSKNQVAIDIIVGIRLLLQTLSSNQAGGSRGFDEEAEASLLAIYRENGSLMPICYHHIFKTQLLYLLDAPEEALRAADVAFEILPAIAGNVAASVLTLFSALSLAHIHETKSGEELRAVWNRLVGYEQQLAHWAGVCPEMFAHMRALVAGEMARLSKEFGKAADFYEQARQLARDAQMIQYEALANELAAKLWLSLGRERLARALLADAVNAYESWGAYRKVARLMVRYRGFVNRGSSDNAASNPERASIVDITSVLEASLTISSEIVLEKLMTKLMAIVVENAGAERGALLLMHEGVLRAEVEAFVDTEQRLQPVVTRVLQSLPVGNCSTVVEAIVQYVARTREEVILSEALREGAFAHNAQVLERRPRSILCTPLLSQGKLQGVIYLENNLTAGAFTADRLEVVRLLCSQTAISIENAIHYADLERRVQERTTELKKKNEDLEATLNRLTTTQRQLVQAEKMASLGMLAAGISHEIQNPLNFINNFAAANVDFAKEIGSAIEENPALRAEELTDLLNDIRVNSEKIAEHGQRAEKIVRSMARHIEGTKARAVESASVNELVDTYIAVAERGMRSRDAVYRVRITRDYGEGVGSVALMPKAIGHVVTNLLNNAFDSLRANRIKSPLIIVSTRRTASEVRIEVFDNGPGVPVEIRERIFEPFFTTKPPGQGTGLGLSLSYDVVVRAHRGMLVLESPPEGGARFIITLPV